MYKDKVMMVCILPSTVYPNTKDTSAGLILPLEACPNVRIKSTVMTMLTKTTKVAQK
jgi:hypothetical protein